MGPFLVMEKKMVQGPIFGQNKFASASSQNSLLPQRAEATEQRQERMH
jgi:hypothetical protein